MTATTQLTPEQLGLLFRLERETLGTTASDDYHLIHRLCTEAIAAGCEGVGQHRGMTARSAAQLLLQLAFPTLPAEVRVSLGIACERVAMLDARAAESH